MSFPNIPNITPMIKLKKQDVVHLVIASIALEEMSLAHILNAEGEKLQAVLEHRPCISDILDINRSTERILRAVIKKQMLLQFKMEDIIMYGREHFKEFFEELEEEEEEEHEE